MPRAGTVRDIVRAGASLAGEIGYPGVTLDLLARPLGGRAPPLGKQRCQPVIALARDVGTTPPPTEPRTRAARQTPARQDPDHIRQSCDRLPRRSRLRMGTSARAALSALAVRTTYPQAAGRAPRVRPPRPRKAKPCRTSPRSWTATGPSPTIPGARQGMPRLPFIPNLLRGRHHPSHRLRLDPARRRRPPPRVRPVHRLR